MSRHLTSSPREALEHAATLAETASVPERVELDSEPLPTRIGRYAVLRRLGHGAMGVVYSAYDPELDRKVAIKVVRDALRARSLSRQRVLQEAQAMARVSHPNVVHVYEVGEDPTSHGNHVFIAMEFVPGSSLSTWQQRHPLTDVRSFDALLRIYLQAAAGLSAAHHSGLIHRDFKPDNVLFGEDGRARVVDFGLARALEPAEGAEPAPSESSPSSSAEGVRSSRERLTQVGTILGTPGFMAPEQVAGEEADGRSDQFSFCAALYEALYGQLPFPGRTYEEFAEKVLAGDLPKSLPRPLGGIEVPTVVEQALRRGLARDPAARFESMQALSAALEQGLLPDADSLESKRLKRRTSLLVAGFILLFFGVRLQTLSHASSDSLASTIPFVGTLVALNLFATISARTLMKRQPAIRRLFYFFWVICAYFAIGRGIAWFIGVEMRQYLIMEMCGIAALIATEVPQAGKPYVLALMVCAVSITLQVCVPQSRVYHLSVAFILLIVLVVFVRALKPAAAADSSAK